MAMEFTNIQTEVDMKEIGLQIKWKVLQYKKGKFTWNNGCIFIGNFKNNQRSGKGELIYPNKHKNFVKYEGNFENDQKNGIGELITTKFVYIGEFKDDKIFGRGTKIFNDGSKYTGLWQNGKLVKASY